VLTVDDLHVTYGSVRALTGVSLSVRSGELVCLIGPNGAGKSTVMRAVSGGLPPLHGHIEFAGTQLTGLKPEHIARLGVSLVPEGRHVFQTLTVRENLLVGSFYRHNRRSRAIEFERALTYFPKLRERINAPAGRLSGGEQQMLVIARALITKPRLLLIDEPSLGLAPVVVSQVYDLLLEVRRKEKLTLLINEQSSHRIIKYADRVYIIRSGEIQLEATATSLTDEQLKHAYFGFSGVDSTATQQVNP
jgi:branched-chain amino acid transport system ATP-binding protein